MMTQIKEITEILIQFNDHGRLMQLVLIFAGWIALTKGLQTALTCGKWWLLTGVKLYHFIWDFIKVRNEKQMTFRAYVKENYKEFIRKELGIAEKNEEKPVEQS